MSQRKSLPTELTEADQALEDLLGNLLADVPEYAVPHPTPATKAPPEQQPGASEPAPAALEQQTGTAAPAPEPLNNSAEAPIQEADALTEPVRPEWSEGEFKVLVVRIGQLRFAVPLVCLNSIARLQDQDALSTIPGQPEWHRGVMVYREQKLVVVDLGSLLQMQAGEITADHMLVIGDGRYGLACGAIEEQLTLRADGVKWRLETDQRDWLLGMLPEQMCALLDLERIAQRLELV